LQQDVAGDADLPRCLRGEAGPFRARTGCRKHLPLVPEELSRLDPSSGEDASLRVLRSQSGASPPYRSLDALNFFLADVHGGLGPYLAIYLLTVRHWDEAEIGIVMSIAGIAGIIAQTPAGALVDAVRAKRVIIVVAALIVT